jgi:hypothetical protein
LEKQDGVILEGLTEKECLNVLNNYLNKAQGTKASNLSKIEIGWNSPLLEASIFSLLFSFDLSINSMVLFLWIRRD